MDSVTPDNAVFVSRLDGHMAPANSLALEACTRGGAYAAFREDDLGTLEEAKLADLAVLSENLFDLDPSRFPEVRVDLTMVGGEVVYERR